MNKNQWAFLVAIIAGVFGLTSLFLSFGNYAATAAPLDAPYPDQRDAVATAVTWLMTTQQNDDGGFGKDFVSGEAASNPSSTLDALLAIAAGGYNAAIPYPPRHNSAIDYLQNNSGDLTAYATTGGATAKVVLALSAANQDATTFASTNWLTVLNSHYNGATGQFDTVAYTQALSILALSVMDEPIPATAVTWLKDQQSVDGSWDDGFGTTQNPDATALAIMALLAADTAVDDPAIIAAKNFLQGAQLATGGWEYGAGFGENANTTALVVQALSALGEDFYSPTSSWIQGEVTPLMALLNWQNNNGAFQADFGQGPFDDFFATVQAIPGASGKPYPLPSRYEVARQAVSCLATLQDPTSGGWEQFAGFGQSAAGTSRAIEAIAAFGADPQSAAWTPGTINAVTALENQTKSYLDDGRGGRAGIVMQGVVAAGAPYDVANFVIYNLPLTVAGYLSPTGEYDSTAFGPNAHAEAMLGLLAAGEAVDETAVEFLINMANNGDWGGSDGNGIALNVLGQLNKPVVGAVENLHTTQISDGGWGFGVPSSPSSTSEVVQGLVANGQNAFAPAWGQIVSGTIAGPAEAIISQQAANGCWPNLFGPGDDPFSTTDAIVMLMQETDWQVYHGYWPVIIRAE